MLQSMLIIPYGLQKAHFNRVAESFKTQCNKKKALNKCLTLTKSLQLDLFANIKLNKKINKLAH